LAFRILDASAFYAGIPFASQEKYYTTSLVFDEVRHIKKDHDALGILFETNRLEIREPDSKFTKLVISESEKNGDINALSKEDISVIALSLELNGELLTDDFAISNVSKTLGIQISPIMTNGITNVGVWIYYCAGCSKTFSKTTKCPLCGNNLRKKLLKKKPAISVKE